MLNNLLKTLLWSDTLPTHKIGDSYCPQNTGQVSLSDISRLFILCLSYLAFFYQLAFTLKATAKDSALKACLTTYSDPALKGLNASPSVCCPFLRHPLGPYSTSIASVLNASNHHLSILILSYSNDCSSYSSLIMSFLITLVRSNFLCSEWGQNLLWIMYVIVLILLWIVICLISTRFQSSWT